MSTPLVYRNYTKTRLQTEHPESRLFDFIHKHNKRPTSSFLNEPYHNKDLHFDREPCTVLNDFKNQLSLFKPDYLISCYNHYPVTKKLSVALYFQKIMEYKDAQVFSIADFGAISPILAIEWSNISDSEVLLVCLEQISSPYDPLPRYPFADAIAAFRITRRHSPLQILAYDYRNIPLYSDDSVQLHDWKLAEESIKMNNEILSELNISLNNVTTIIQSYSKDYTIRMKQENENLVFNSIKKNLSTADVFYSLETFLQTDTINTEYVLLNFVDFRGKIGCLVMEIC
ncbi:hypothetical protein FZD47_20670 [Bacillus infantis]|uniref:Uncharacterized protein n=1 Tax=Bacillus infantis TaxID=324767 RepID=A0A5D4SEU0_9BACI|nr:hypothetical protein [Bacillus infantis]TYS60624.1 hypothetical protein FZD47_20670 [Bacillus infantis]